MATALANRLRRLEAIREASNRLMNRPQLQRDIFPRGNPETIAEIRHPKYTATLFDLLTAYAAQRQQRVLASVHLARRTVWSLSEARASLERLIGMAEDWSRLDEYLIRYVVDPSQKATVFASSFAAALELVPGTDTAGVLLIGKGGKWDSMGGTSDLPHLLDELQIFGRDAVGR